MLSSDKKFDNSIPQLYEKYLVPLIFEPYARDLIERLRKHKLSRILEIAAGTGVVTRFLASELPDTVSIVATDLNQSMLDEAIEKGISRPIEWQQADAMDLPFEDEIFDAVVCQFGAMFFPDKIKAYEGIYRILKPGGIFLFNVWDTVKENDYAVVTVKVLESLFPKDTPKFLSRTPYGYNDKKEISDQLTKAGFKKNMHLETVTKWSRATSARIPAISFTQGIPLRNEIEARGMPLDKVTDAVEKEMIKAFGKGPVKTKMQAIVINAEK